MISVLCLDSHLVIYLFPFPDGLKEETPPQQRG